MRWDIFCQIVDNYGDAGVCWRLARSLSSIHGQDARIFCDDLPTLNLLASGVDPTIRQKIDLQPWESSFINARHPVQAPDVVIEVFGCDLPECYLTGLFIAPVKPIILNLEYLSAEPWITECHGKASPQSHGIPKYFFFPGFQDEVGGLLLDPIPKEGPLTENQIPKDLTAAWSKLRPTAKRISVFCYPGAPLKKWLESLSHLGEDVDVLLTHGHAEQLNLHGEQSLSLPNSLQLLSIPFVTQDEYDWVLAQCDLNIVRGEDSFVRAQLAGKPFIWHIYPQVDRAHEVKLAAFLDLYLENASQALKLVTIAAMAWAMPSEWFNKLEIWHLHAKHWRTHLLEKHEDGGLPARLISFLT
ncbi:elongation factor P maturation arginine rhamnosyltransferase EarP [Polynucleobacter necessarius]|uniref:elongation factor P maturation arginine rhamnosyltransferase EarP n=1 Tax=Polynucleobacter necessarius TaxID=576610 RepID=UPI000E098444|nr:elongation factor P maturation arginine rhamnosyltransferase EarP [Polynucleobacter necessarius]HAT39016.1 elongation factor P maturation arginine rhamnosyltransferase EarP [Polynucleobacter sp.]